MAFQVSFQLYFRVHKEVYIYICDWIGRTNTLDQLDQVLWPILHYQAVSFNDEAWEAYKKVNEIFAENVADAAGNGDLIWVCHQQRTYYLGLYLVNCRQS